MRCIEPKYADRYQSAAALAAALDEILGGSEEAVTTVDLTHRGGAKAIKGMRVPARPPRLTPTPVIVDPTLRALVPTVSAPVVPASPPTTPTGVDDRAATAPTGDAANREPPATADAAPAEATPTPPPQPTPSVVTEPILPGDDDAPPVGSAVPRLTPSVPEPAPMTPDTTLVGPLPTPRPPARPAPRVRRPSSSAPRQRPSSTSPGTGRVTTNLREAYPTIHRSPPSPLRPQPSAFDDRPPSSVNTGPVFDTSGTVRRDAFVRYLVLGVAVAISIFIAFLLATW
jgi:hypothetical protein